MFKFFGWGVIIETGRSEAGLIWEWLEKWGFKYKSDLSVDYINQSPINLELNSPSPKIIADLCIDDRNYPFCGEPPPLEQIARDLVKRGILKKGR